MAVEECSRMEGGEKWWLCEGRGEWDGTEEEASGTEGKAEAEDTLCPSTKLYKYSNNKRK